MHSAFAERGVARHATGSSNARVAEYNRYAGLPGYDDKISWCSSFVNWCMASVGVRGTGSGLARSWLEWGRALDAPVPGCVVVLTRDEPDGWQGHVGFYLRHDADSIYLFGGNQLDEVRELAYARKLVLGYRWPDSAAMPLPPPVLRTQRLVMSPPRLDDFEDSYAMWSDVSVVHHVTGKALTREEVWARLLRGIGHWSALGLGHWIVREKSQGKFIGEVGFLKSKRGIDVALENIPEIGWMLASAFQGQGLASEAVQAALKWSDAQWPGEPTVCLIAPKNHASLKLAERRGYAAERKTIYKDHETFILRRPGGN